MNKDYDSASSCQILWRLVKSLPRYGDFSIFKTACLDHSRTALFDSLHCCAKFVWNRCSSFYRPNTHDFLDFASLAWKCLFTTQNGILEQLTAQMKRHINKTPKRHILGRKYVMAYRIDRQIGSPVRPVHVTKRPKRKEKERNLIVPNWVFAENAHVVGSKSNFAQCVVFES